VSNTPTHRQTDRALYKVLHLAVVLSAAMRLNKNDTGVVPDTQLCFAFVKLGLLSVQQFCVLVREIVFARAPGAAQISLQGPERKQLKLLHFPSGEASSASGVFH